MKTFLNKMKYYFIIILIYSIFATWHWEMALFYLEEPESTWLKYQFVQLKYSLFYFVLNIIIPCIIGIITWLITKNQEKIIRNTKISLAIVIMLIAASRISVIVKEKNQQKAQIESERIYKGQLIQREFKNKKDDWNTAFQITSNTTTDMGFTYWKTQRRKDSWHIRISTWKKYSYVDKLAICRNAMAINTGFYFTAEMSDEVRNNTIDRLKYKTAELLVCIEENVSNGELDEELFTNLEIHCIGEL